ncbi:unnamed protein product, partial [Prorocentrum cordatum]
VGSTTRACTEGLWLWGSADSEDDQSPLLVFMDCEGFGSTESDRTRDAQLMTLCALMSSVMVLNTKGTLNEGIFNALALVCRFAEHIEERRVIPCGMADEGSDAISDINDESADAKVKVVPTINSSPASPVPPTPATSQIGSFPSDIMTVLQNMNTALANAVTKPDITSLKGPEAIVTAKNMQMSYTINFAPVDIASVVLDSFKNGGISWTDPRTNMAMNLRCRLDASQQIRNRHKVLGRLWQAFVTHMKENGTWKQDYCLGGNGPRGLLFLLCGSDDVEVLAPLVEVADDSYAVELKYDSLAQFGIDRAAADKIVASSLP